MVEFALSSVVLILLVGGLVDIGRSIFVDEALSNAAREGARHGAWFDQGTQSHPYLEDAQIKAAVDAELATISLPASVLKNPGATCPGVTDGNAYYNPPYVGSAYPAAANQPWLYICYDNTPGLDFTSPATNQGQHDLNVIVLYQYGPLTPVISSQFGLFRVAANEHITVQGS
ncbi:MAG TPA: TadE/TadG family type IV pilus assembly protein [Candidatus Dormibacteraeota bacterium]|nr:TadE/TadG family type IV pilus assembly protein [Candidatus Dormibacteraeota bacterium]